MSLQAFKDAIAKFNYADPGQGGSGKYDAVKPYLAPSCFIHRVNDPNNPLKGTPQEVVDTLNESQAKKKIWPKLQYIPEHVPVPGALSENCHWVTGAGLYTDGAAGIKPVLVEFAYHFDGKDKIDMVHAMIQAVLQPGQPQPADLTLGPKPS